MTDENKVRADKWLWAARFFKTRALASEAIQGGHVHINGSRIKPSRPVAIGDEIKIQKGNESFLISVTGISAKRGPANQAQLLYSEHESSIAKRAMLQEERRLFRSDNPAPRKRPDKRSRRHIIRFVRKQVD